jgi:hypothetical protein
MKNLTPELIEKAKNAKSAAELLALAKENNVEITEDMAKTYFAQLNAIGSVSDEELDAVAGGGLFCPSDEEDSSEKEEKPARWCPFCGGVGVPGANLVYRCKKCAHRFR